MLSEEEYKQLRGSNEQKANLRLARAGNDAAKRRLVQFNYSGHYPQGVVKGMKLPSGAFGFDMDEPETFAKAAKLLLKEPDKYGLLMLERSARQGGHAVFEREKGKTVLENQVRIATMLKCEMDTSAHDINREEEYKQLRGSNEQKANLRLARAGNDAAKRRLVQFNYSGHYPQGVVKGMKLPSGAFGFDMDEPETFAKAAKLLLKEPDKYGLLMLERSARQGGHAVFEREKGKTVLENQVRIATMLKCEMDTSAHDINRLMLERSARQGGHAVFEREKGKTVLENQVRIATMLKCEMDTSAHDINRVYFTTTSDGEDLLFLSPRLFKDEYDEAAVAAEGKVLEERERYGQEELPEGAHKANKHYALQHRMEKICSSFRHGSSRMNMMRLPWQLKGRFWKSVKDTDRRNCRKERTRQTSIMSLGKKNSRRILKGFLRVRNLRIREFHLLLLQLLLQLLLLLRTIILGFLMGKSLRSGGNCIMMGRSRCAPTAIR